LHTQCNGNPFFVTELLALLAARRAEAGVEGDLADAEVLERDEALPSTVRQTLARRLDRLGMTTRVLLRTGSVLGLRFGADLVAALAGQDRIACEDALDEAVAAGLLQEEAMAAGTGYVLVHSLLRRTLYEELLPGRRRRLHERAGQELAARHESRGSPSAETIAHHFVRTDDHARAAYWLAKAGDHAASLHASAPAIQYYVQACEHVASAATGGGELPDPARLHERLGDLRLLEGEYEAARENFARAGAFGGSAEARAALWVKEGTTWEKRSDYDRALAAFNQAEGALGGAAPGEGGARRALVASIALRRGEVHFLRSDHAGALDSADLALHLLGEDAEHIGAARAHNLIGRVACLQGAYDAAEERHGRALVIFERLGDLGGAALCWNNQGAVAWYRSDYDLAEQCFRHCLALRERIGDQEGIAGAWSNLGLIAANRGDIAEAEARHRRALAIQERTGNLHAEAYSLSALGLMAYQRCDFAAAEAYYMRCLPVFEQIADRTGVAHVKHSLGLLAIDRGDYGAAECHVRESLVLHEQLGDPAGIAHQLLRMSVVAWARGDLDRAAEWLERAHHAAQEISYEPVLADAAFNLGRLAGERGDYQGAVRALRRAHRMIRRIGGVEEALLTMLECVHVYCLAGMAGRAARLFSAVDRAVARRGVGPATLKVMLTRAETALSLMESDRALAAAEEGLALARARGQRREEGLALTLAGRACLAAGKLNQGEQYLREGVQVLDGIGSALEMARARLALASALDAGAAGGPGEATALWVPAESILGEPGEAAVSV
ncbi:MAG: ATP-binding protein, partial [Chloroflexota bacterium]